MAAKKVFNPSSYSEKLKDPRWQKMRLVIMNRDGFQCQECKSTDKTLHVHHKYYISGREPWEYNEKELITLCFECHEKEEVFKAHFKKNVEHILAKGVNYIKLWALIEILMNIDYESGFNVPDTLNALFHVMSNEDLLAKCIELDKAHGLERERIYAEE